MSDKLPEGWVETTLGEVAEINPRESIKKGALAKAVPMNKLGSFEKKIIGFEIKNFKGGTKFRNGDTLLARITPCLENGKTAYVDILDEGEIGFGSTEYIVIRKKEQKSDKQFLFYFSISPKFREVAIKLMTGTSGRQRVQTQQLVNYPFILPLLPEQKAIAAVLSAFDDKIELLREQNETLETLAQTIFKQWFVHFNFPDQNGKPYRENGGEMVDSELGEIPKGWKCKEIKTVADRIAMGPFGSNIKVSTFVDKGVPVISGQHLHGTMLTDGSNNFITPEHAEKLKNSRVVPGDIIFTHAGNIGQVSIIPKNAKYQEYVISQRQFFLRVDKERASNWFLLMFFKSRMGQHLLLSNSSQVGVPSIARPSTHLKSIRLPFPTKEIQNKFEKLTIAIMDKIHFNHTLIEQLSKTRDTLLPKLMNGEIRVKGFEQ